MMVATSSGKTPSNTMPPRMGAKMIILEGGGGGGPAGSVAKDTTHCWERLFVSPIITTPYTEAAANPTSPTKVRLSANRVTKGVL